MSVRKRKIMAMGDSLEISKPRLSINDLGYQFKEVRGRHVLLDGKDGGFESDVHGARNQNRYEDLGEAITEYVYEYLENKLHFEKVTIPVDARPNEPKGFFFMSKDALECDTLMIPIHGSGVERAGQWARCLIINDSFESGTMVPYIEKAIKEGFGVLITNGNHNCDENPHKLIKGSENPQDHFVYVWNNFIKKAKAKHIVIVAHGSGEVVVLHSLRNIEEAKERIKAVAFTNSVHSVGHYESRDIKQFFKEKAKYWVCSEEPLDTPVKINREDVCHQVSAGTMKHAMTTHVSKDSVFKFFREKLSADYLKNNTLTIQDSHREVMLPVRPCVQTNYAASSFIKPTQLDRIPPQYQPHKLDSVYKMTSSPRGLAVIVNMNNFQSNTKIKKRKGSEKDKQGLVNLFKELDFETETLVDLTKEELLSKFQDITKYHFGAYDCLIVCIMSHGDEDYFVACDGGKIKIQIIRDEFNNNFALCGKPKLFFINACRGALKDHGTVVKESGSKSLVKPQPSPEPEADIAVENCGRKTTAKNADMLTAFSSVEGYPSYRDPVEGSWFISSLIEVFKEYAGVEDVTDMLIRVNKEVNSKGSLGRKQVPEPKNTLTKKVFFWPGVTFK